MGYLGSSMAYTESENATERLKEFLSLLKHHRFPCDGFHLSSGYTTDQAGRRCVFTWNQSRVPDPTSMFADFNAQGVNVIANVKPWLLTEHPAFETAKASGLFFKSADSEPSYGRFWVGGAGTSGLGCYLDFTNPASVNWWKTQAKSSLLELGCRALWNDNNEYEVDESRATISSGETVEASGRAIHTLLMARASRDALREHFGTSHAGDVLVVSRSGSIGTHRYAAQTWSGDNSTSWETLRFNIAMCLSLGLSGWPGSGPDVGGFAGARPSPELFLRWVQCGIFMPRFSIHSSVWKNTEEDQQAPPATNEPWMFPELTDDIRKCVETRYRLGPWLYSLHIQATESGVPVARALMYEYADERSAREQSFQFLLGGDVLVAPVHIEGANQWEVYFPGRKKRWFDIDGLVAYEPTAVNSGMVDMIARTSNVFAGTPVFIRQDSGIVLGGEEFGPNGEYLGSDKRVVILALNYSGYAEVTWRESEEIVCSCKVNIRTKEVSVTAGFARTGRTKRAKAQATPSIADSLTFVRTGIKIMAYAIKDEATNLDLHLALEMDSVPVEILKDD